MKTPVNRSKFQQFVQVCQDELKKTTEIGRRMLSASKANSSLHEAYEELGRLAARSLREGHLEWNHPRVRELLNIVESCESDIQEMEKEINYIRFVDKKPQKKAFHEKGAEEKEVEKSKVTPSIDQSSDEPAPSPKNEDSGE